MSKLFEKYLRIVKHAFFMLALFLCQSAVAQQTQISGTVSDQNGAPVIGATVIVAGTTTGAVTDATGSFSLSVQPNATLNISMLGYLTQEVQVAAGRTRYDITMRENIETLDDVIVIGYGSIKRSDVTGSVVSVNAEEMMKRNPTTLGQGLQGIAAGVSVFRNSGDPRGQTTIRIRGVATINNSADPLFVVDGVKVGRNIDFLNPNDVQSMEVLKDASATAIYGSEGANGVIMITTRRGERGRTNLRFSANYGVATLAKTLDVMNASEFVAAARRASVSDGSDMTNGAWSNPAYTDRVNSIDWQREMSQTALSQSYNLTVSGGSENTQAVMSIGYNKNQGQIITSYFNRLTARVNVDHKIKEFIRTGANISYMHSERSGGGNLLTYATIIPTMDDVDGDGNLINVPVQYSDGTWGHFKKEANGDTNKGQDNPVAAARTRDQTNYDDRVLANAYIDFDIVKGLVFKTIGSFNYGGNRNHNFGIWHDRVYGQEDRPNTFSSYQQQNMSLQLESFLTYDLAIRDIHRINLMAGYSISKYTSQDSNASSNNFPAETIRRIELTSEPATIAASGGLGLESRGESYFARINYSLLDRYVFTATIRRDGSSNFGSGNRYGTFPSAALAWRVSEENFMKGASWLSNLKLRLGWGTTGNAGNATNLAVNQLSSYRIAYYYWADNAWATGAGMAQTREIDTNLKWETNVQTNIGLDFGFLGNSLNFSLDYFVRDAKDLLLNRSIRPSTGYQRIYTNAGHIRNSGIEFLASYQKQMGDWYFNVRLNGSTLKNKAISVGDDIYESGDEGEYWDNFSVTRNGYPIASFYAWRVDGIFQTREEIEALKPKDGSNSGHYQSASTQPGDYKYKDLDGNGYIDSQDREIIGHGFPKFNYGLNFTLQYKSWDMNMNLAGVLGQQILSNAYKDLTTMYITTGGYRNVLREYAENAWTSENRSTKYPRLTKQDANHNSQVSDVFLLNGDYLKVQNLQIGYTFPKRWLQPLRMETARAYVGIENVLTITGYKGGEPEIGGNSLLRTGYDGGRYPFPRTYVFGLSIGF